MSTTGERIERFIDELRRDSRFAASADSFADCYAKLDLEADGNSHAMALEEALLTIGEAPQPLERRIEKQHELLRLRGWVCINLKEFCGW
jgi:hypothetical protein